MSKTAGKLEARLYPIDNATVVVDLRCSRQGVSVQSDVARKCANKHFWGNEEGNLSEGIAKTSILHVSSVHKGVWVASTGPIDPSKGKSVAIRFHEDHPLNRFRGSRRVDQKV